MDALAAGPVTIDTPLGDAITFHSMTGSEGLSQLFAYELDVLSPRADLNAADLLGHPVTVHLERGDDEQQVRHWNGCVTGFQYIATGDDGFSRYLLTVHPWLWYLTQSADCRIFQHMRIPDIVMKVFRDRGFTDFDNALSETYAQQEYVVQYRETDFEFVSRLMEREGIYYFFRHVDGRHTLVLADAMGAHEPAPSCKQLAYAPPDPHRNAMEEYVRQWRAMTEVATTRYSHADYDFTRPRLRLNSISTTPDREGAPSLARYDYPGGFSSRPAGDASSALRLGQRRSNVQGWTGETNGRGLTVGCNFKLVDHPRDDQNRKYLVTGAYYLLRGQDIRTSIGPQKEEPFSCEFQVILASVTFRAPASAPKPLMLGPQTAVVVGPLGQEIWTDQFGRVKVQFHWDREGQHDEQSSCFVRVSQAWAGTGWGAQFIPRIGQEVIVDFIEGDPDRPIITGSVYNGANEPAFKLPNNQTQSGIRTRSTPGGTQVNGNEIRFEDAKGNEELYVQAEKNQTTLVKDSQSETVGHNRSVSVGLADALTIGLTRSIQVGAASVTTVGGDSSEAVGGLRTVTVGGQNIAAIALGSVTEVGGDMLSKVGGVTRFDLNGPLRVSTAADESRTTGGKLEVRVGEDASYVYAAEAKTVIGHPNREARLSAFVYGTSTSSTSKELVIESDTSIVLKCGDTKVVVTPDGVTIDGKTLAWNAGTKLSVASPNASLTSTTTSAPSERRSRSRRAARSSLSIAARSSSEPRCSSGRAAAPARPRRQRAPRTIARINRFTSGPSLCGTARPRPECRICWCLTADNTSAVRRLATG